MEKILLEIGTEEIPAGYIGPALTAMEATLSKKLTAARIAHGKAQVLGTPRRLTILVDDVVAKQKSETTEVVGPPVKIAYDDAGKPTMAAKKFAEKVGVALGRLTEVETPKGRYLCAKKTERGLATRTLLKTILPEVILSLPFPKTMKWGDLHVLFARPIQYILALYGKQIVSFDIEGLKSGRTTCGHYFMAPKPIRIDHPDNYAKTLAKVNVMVDFESRRSEVAKGVDAAAAKAGGKVLADEELLDTVTNLIEYPVPVTGRFDDDFLKLPDEILITAMREHQKYFAVVDDDGKLLPAFIAVNNTIAKDLDLVATGHERVLRARLADAQFFYNSDVKAKMDDWVAALKGVLFQAKLGSMHAKVLRVQKLSQLLAKRIQETKKRAKGLAKLPQNASRAALLTKADLVSAVVGEFPRLQGVMGRIYAAVAGETAEVAQAVEEHYRPTYSGGPLPTTLTGAVVSIADKIDSICGCFSADLIPTGASDPYALRRQAIGVVQIIRANDFAFSIAEMIDHSLKNYGLKLKKDRAPIAAKVMTFLKNRIDRILVEEGFSKDVVAAVTQVSIDHLPHVWRRVEALEALKSRPDFDPLAAGFKRVVNIIKKAKVKSIGQVKEALLQEKAERDLFKTYGKVDHKVRTNLERANFDQALRNIAGLKTAVDTFFDDVMVMTDDKKLRQNRLALLNAVAGLFQEVADFSKITT